MKISDSTKLFAMSQNRFKPLYNMNDEEISKMSEYVSTCFVKSNDIEKEILEKIEQEAERVLNCQVHPPDLNQMRRDLGLKVEEFKATYMNIEGKRRLMMEVKIEQKSNGNGAVHTFIRLPSESLIKELICLGNL